MRQIKKIITILLVSIISGYLMLTAVYSINTDKMIENTRQTIADFEKEEIYEPISFLDNSYLLDNYTDSLMISQSIFQINDSPLIASVKNERFYYENTDARLFISSYIANKEYKTVSYSRYWHGYLIFLKPLLYFFNYHQIRLINLVVQSLLTLIAVFLIFKKINWNTSLAFAGSLLILAPPIVAKSLQFSTIYYLTLISSMYILIKINTDTSLNEIKLTFLVIGILTSFMDLLTYPILTYGIPIILILISKKDIQVKDFIMISLYWLLGYIFMWAGKWIISSVILNQNVLKNAFDTINTRTSNIAIDEKISRFDVIITNYRIGTSKNLLLINALIFIINIIKNKFRINKGILLYLLFISIIPVLWFFVTSNHASIHYFYTYRIIMITFMALHTLVI